jgi:superfamily I DNA/RNA helicase
LESPVVIIIDIDENAFADDEQKRIFYVACSRATHQLCLFVTGDKAIINKIGLAINGGKNFAPQGKIIMKTQSQLIDL